MAIKLPNRLNLFAQLKLKMLCKLRNATLSSWT